MTAKTWKEIRRGTAEQNEQIRRKVQNEVKAGSLKELRKLIGKTQVDVAELLKLSQGQISKTETGDDYLLSTLRRYVEALGGELELRARFGDLTVLIPKPGERRA